MHDLGQDRATAIDTLRSSSAYGYCKFPLDPEDEPKYDLIIAEAYRNMHVLTTSAFNEGKDNTSNASTPQRLRSKASPSTELIVSLNTGEEEELACGPARKRRKVSHQ